MRKCNTVLENRDIEIFRDSRNNYGTRKIKKLLESESIVASRFKINDIMKKYGLVSNYTIKQFKIHKTKFNNYKVENVVNRESNDRDDLDVVVSDLIFTGRWNSYVLL